MLKTGAIIADRYEIVGRIGSGGMADVYKGKDHKLNRNVAVKVMKVEFNNDESFIRKFRREAQAAAGLANPNIVNVFDVGEDRGLYFIVMELVEGITLKEYVAKKHKLSVREATSIAIQVCMGLSAAHAQGIVHRDIKPQNIMISTDGKVKVTDFGIARAASSNTISANAMGSVHYSSPEQVRGGYSDAKSDIYSLGITLYEMVTGKVPFDGETTVAIAIKHLQDEMDPPSKYTPDLPYSLEQIIYKCTQKSPDRRYNSVNEVIADLKRSLTDPDGRFVNLAPLSDHAQTVMLSPAEMAAIKDSASGKKNEKAVQPVRDSRYERDDDDDDLGDDDDAGISTRLEKAMTIGGFIIGVIIIGILVYFIGRAAGIFRSGDADTDSSSIATESMAESSVPAADDVEVPLLLGLTREQAQVAVQGTSIGIKYAGAEPSEEYAENQICRQEPEAHTMVPKNSTIIFYVSSGRNQIQIPKVVGLLEEEATTLLEQSGFTNVSVVTDNSDTVTSGTIMSVSPGEGVMSDPDTQVVLTVSIGPESSQQTVTMLNWAGIDEATATGILQGQGFRVKIDYGYTNTLGIGSVMDSIPKPGEIAYVGQEITLIINSLDYKEQESEEETPDESEAEEGDGNTGPATVNDWVTDVRLDTTSEYQGGPWRLTLVQEVNGASSEVTVAEGQELSFPYEFKYSQGASGVATGDVYLYELVGDNYVRKAKWQVPFQQAG